MGVSPPLAAFGTTDLNKGIGKKGGEQKQKSKYEDFLGAIHDVAFSDKNVDMQTRLEWDNIEGEVMAEVLAADLMTGTMFTKIEDDLWNFATPEEIMQEMFATEIARQYIEFINKRPYLLPAISVMKKKLNELVVSLGGLGRQELIQMLQSFQVSMQENERNDALMKGLRRG
jgi:hypothetical protein